MVTWGDVKQWNGNTLAGAVGPLNREYNELSNAGEDLGKIQSPDGWSGEAAQAAGSRCGELIEALGEWTGEIAAARTAFTATSDAIGGVKNGVTEAEEVAKANNFRIADDGSIADHGVLADTPKDQREAVAQERARVKTELQERVKNVLRSAKDVDNDFCKVLDKILGDTVDADSDATSLAAAGKAGAKVGSLTIPTPPPMSDATVAQNAAWWATLSDAQRKRFIQDFPAQVGPRDGIPVVDRHSANQSIIKSDASRLRTELSEKKKELSENAGPGGTGKRLSLQGEIDDLEKKLGGISSIENSIKDGNHYLLKIDSSDDGRAIVASGNPDTAKNVTTLIPGTGSDLNNIGDTIDRADVMQREADKLGSGSNAVISWMDYDAPDSIPNAASESYAEDAKKGLDQFQDGLRESHEGPPSRNTVVGHSYGSTVAGYAARDETLDIDSFVAVGSPGVGTDNAADLNVPGDDVHAIAAENDIVADLEAFGNAPTDSDFGANNIESQPGTSGWFFDYSFESHSEYWDPRSKSLRGMAKVMVGDS